jgi:hypothetical protein
MDETSVGPTVSKKYRRPILFPPHGRDLCLELEQSLPKQGRRGESFFPPLVGRPVDDEDIFGGTVVVPCLYSYRQAVLRVKPDHVHMMSGESGSMPSWRHGIFRAGKPVDIACTHDPWHARRHHTFTECPAAEGAWRRLTYEFVHRAWNPPGPTDLS